MPDLLPALLHAEEHLDEDIGLDDLAAVAGLSPFHFHRVFQRAVGETPACYLRRLRLERAVLRLKVSPDNLLEIGLAAGYSTNETFTRAFRTRFGTTPSEFRRAVREYRSIAAELFSDHEVDLSDGFTDSTPLVLRFDMHRAPVTVERTPGRHLIFVRHHGFESLDRSTLWDPLLAFAPDGERIGITHDDPYVTDEALIRFDACLEVAAATTPPAPFGYRWMPPALCVVRSHDGGAEEIARTFAYIGVEWLPSDNYHLSAAPPFEVHRRDGSAAYVPLEERKR